MSVFRNIVFVSLCAGVLAGLLLAAIQQFSTVPLISRAEVYEQAEGAPAHDRAAAAHDHDGALATAAGAEDAAAAPAEEWVPSDGLERIAYTVLADVLAGIGFALILVAVSELRGGLGSWREGMLWGLAGFVACTVAPAFGLSPELPAIPAAPLAERQIWWLATALLTAGGIALLVFRRSLPAAIAAVVMIAAPHVIGAPRLDTIETPIPEGLEHDFVAAVVVASLVFWVVIGGLSGFFRRRLAPAA
jgi:cobalt transporter subunit CbtA